MAIIAQDGDGKRYTIFPSHDPDQQDHGQFERQAVDRTRDGVIDAARQICPNVDAVSGEEYIQALEDALAAYDAAVAENRAHDEMVGEK